jgi:hypothetical protein
VKPPRISFHLLLKDSISDHCLWLYKLLSIRSIEDTDTLHDLIASNNRLLVCRRRSNSLDKSIKMATYIYFHQVTFSNPRWLLEVLFYIYPCLCFSNRWFCLSCTVPSNWYFISHRCCFVYPDCVLVMFHLIDISYLTGVVLFTRIVF